MASTTANRVALDGEKYISLETYRMNGKAVRTPVWFASAPAGSGSPPMLYVYTTADSGKAKRIRRNGQAKVAPCDVRGQIKGAWMDAAATIVSGAEFDLGMQLIDRKYRPWKQLLDLSHRLFQRHERVVLAVRLTEAAPGATTPAAV